MVQDIDTMWIAMTITTKFSQLTYMNGPCVRMKHLYWALIMNARAFIIDHICDLPKTQSCMIQTYYALFSCWFIQVSRIVSHWFQPMVCKESANILRKPSWFIIDACESWLSDITLYPLLDVSYIRRLKNFLPLFQHEATFYNVKAVISISLLTIAPMSENYSQSRS